MSTIDKIMGAIGRHGDDCIRDADAASESFEALREMIAAALADARRDGAEAMREEAAGQCDLLGGPIDRRDPDEVRLAANSLAHAIRALPLPTEVKRLRAALRKIAGIGEHADAWADIDAAEIADAALQGEPK